MLHIAICDDERPFVAHLSQLLERYSRESGCALKVSAYSDGMHLVEHYDPTLDLIFLDIRMRLLDGLGTARALRRLDSEVAIIFLTTLTDYALEGYDVQATNYIIKPIGYARLKAEMDKFIARQRRKEQPALVISDENGHHRVPLSSLRFIETEGRSLLCHTEQGDLRCHKSMKAMEAALAGTDLVRCHTSYIVNLRHVQGVQKLEITLTSGERLPISQPKRKTFMARLAEHWGDAL